MDNFRVNRLKKRKSFTIIDNTILRDKNISLKAKALFCYLLTLPPNWNLSQQGLVSCIKEGKTAANSALKELEKYGYLKTSTEREHGRLYTLYEVYEIPYEQYFSASEKPKKKIRSRKSKTENHTQINNKKNNNIINSNIVNSNIINMCRIDKEILENIKTNIDYNMLIEKHNAYDIDRIVKTIYDVLVSGDEDEITKDLFSRLHSSHIEYALKKAESNSKNIRNYSAWLKKVISNIPPKEIHVPRESDFTNYIVSEDGW